MIKVNSKCPKCGEGIEVTAKHHFAFGVGITCWKSSVYKVWF